MELIIKKIDSLPCCTEKFTINGIDAEKNDFGEGYDNRNYCTVDYSDAIARWGCVNRVWKRKHSTPEVLSKYNITQDEYNTIVLELEEKLSIGRCGWCV